MEILIVRDGEQFGPYTNEEVRDYLADGALLSTDLAWHEGLADWTPVHDVELQCAPQKTPPPPSRIAPKPSVAQALTPWAGLGTPQGLMPDSSLLNGFIIIPANLNGELTREIAAQLLNEQLATPHVTQLAFEFGAVNRAVKDGWIAPGRDHELFGTYNFDFDKTSFIHRLTGDTDQIRRPEEDPSGKAQTPFFQLATPLTERVEKITGITAGPLGSRILQAEYISAFSFPKDMQTILPYIFTGQRGKAAFQRYDDGWRIVNDL